MDILPIIKHGSGCDYHRLVLPLEVMGLDLDTDEILGELLTKAKIVIFNRHIDNFEDILIARAKYGFKLIVDLDDYWELYQKHDLYQAFKHFNQGFNIQVALANADVITVTTEILADKVRPINQNVYVVPNAIPENYKQFNDLKNESEGKFRLLYAGGSSHFWDIKQIETLFYKIKNSNLDKKLELHLCGYQKGENSKNVWDKILDMFSAKGKIDVRLHGNLPVNKYMNHYNNADLTIAPLERNKFNAHKSNLKILEAGCKKLPIIVSDVPPYSLEVDKSIIKATTSSDWFNKIKYLVDNPNYAKDKGLELHEFVMTNYNMNSANKIRQEIFQKLLK